MTNQLISIAFVPIALLALACSDELPAQPVDNAAGGMGGTSNQGGQGGTGGAGGVPPVPTTITLRDVAGTAAADLPVVVNAANGDVISEHTSDAKGQVIVAPPTGGSVSVFYKAYAFGLSIGKPSHRIETIADFAGPDPVQWSLRAPLVSNTTLTSPTVKSVPVSGTLPAGVSQVRLLIDCGGQISTSLPFDTSVRSCGNDTTVRVLVEALGTEPRQWALDKTVDVTQLAPTIELAASDFEVPTSVGLTFAGIPAGTALRRTYLRSYDADGFVRLIAFGDATNTMTTALPLLPGSPTRFMHEHVIIDKGFYTVMTHRRFVAKPVDHLWTLPELAYPDIMADDSDLAAPAITLTHPGQGDDGDAWQFERFWSDADGNGKVWLVTGAYTSNVAIHFPAVPAALSEYAPAATDVSVVNLGSYVLHDSSDHMTIATLGSNGALTTAQREPK